MNLKWLVDCRRAKSADINFLKTDYIIPKSGRIQVDGDLLLVNSRMIEEVGDVPMQVLLGSCHAYGSCVVLSSQPKVNAVSFIAEDVVIGGVKQWKLVRHENFEGANAAAVGVFVSCSSYLRSLPCVCS